MIGTVRSRPARAEGDHAEGALLLFHGQHVLTRGVGDEKWGLEARMRR